MKVLVSPGVARKYKKLVCKYPGLSKLVDRKLKVLAEDPNNPSLRLHKLSGKLGACWSISVKRDLRLIFQYVEEGIYVMDLGSHDEVY